jgi:hypothetical protein
MMKNILKVAKLYEEKLTTLGWEDKLPGGEADEYSPEDFDPKVLEDGIKVEKEHTNDPEIAAEITMDHIVETEKKNKENKNKADLVRSDYYTFLKHMEKLMEELEE